MALTDPPPMVMEDIWNNLFSNVYAGFGWSFVFVLVIVSAMVFFVYKTRGDIHLAKYLFVILLLAAVNLGLPSWVVPVVFSYIAWRAIRWYRRYS